jgi:hypothetical protein
MWWSQEKYVQTTKVGKTGSAVVSLKLDHAFNHKQGRKAADELWQMRARGELCDVTLALGQELFPVHSVVVAARSKPFADFRTGSATDAFQWKEAASAAESQKDVVTTAPAPAEKEPKRIVAVKQEACRDAVELVLGYMYLAGDSEWEYNPVSAQVNKDVFNLATHFSLPSLREHAVQWLAKGVTTENVVESLITCEMLGLTKLREQIVELVVDSENLSTVVSNPGLAQHPRILQDLLMQVAKSRNKPKEAQPECEEKPNKRPRKH